MSTDPEPDPLDAVFDAIRREPVPDRPPDAELLAWLAAGPSPAAQPVTLARRRMIMRIAKWSLAAAVLAAVGAAVLFTSSANIALADVLKAAENHKLVKFKATATITYHPGGEEENTETKVELVYADLRAARFRQESPEAVRGPFRSSGYAVYDYTKDRCLGVYNNQPTDGAGAGEKGAVLSILSTAPNYQLTKRTLLDELRELESHKDAKVVKEDKSVRYTVVDGKETTTLWVDTATKLPVRMVVEVEPSETRPRIRIESTDFEWDPELKEFKSLDDVFSLTPPEGYKLEDRTKQSPEKP
jgi:outer membrane lipoprotein-sorting protein